VTEADVALTDFVLTIECAAFSLALAKKGTVPLSAVFALSAIASALGGIVHGFTPEPDSPVYRVLWPATVLSIVGAAAAMAWAAIAILGWRSRSRISVVVLAIAFAAYVVTGHDDFFVAIAAYAPASLFLVVAFLTAREWIGVLGLLLALAAGGLQQAEFTPLPGLSHNAFYHLLQMAALAMLFVAARRIPERR
jgi:hypothetical protein